MSAVWGVQLPDSEKIVLLALADCANDDGVCWPSMRALVEKCSKTDRTIQAAIKSLTAAGHLTRVERPGKGVLYTVHPGRSPEAVSPPKSLPPEDAAPPKPTTLTPEAASDKPSRTTNSSNATHPKIASTPKARWPKDMPPPTGVSDDQWAGFIEHRKAKRSTLTRRAYDLLVAKLAEHSTADRPPGALVDLIVERGWLTFEPHWIMKSTDTGNGKRPHHERRSRGLLGAVFDAERDSDPQPGFRGGGDVHL